MTVNGTPSSTPSWTPRFPLRRSTRWPTRPPRRGVSEDRRAANPDRRIGSMFVAQSPTGPLWSWAVGPVPLLTEEIRSFRSRVVWWRGWTWLRVAGGECRGSRPPELSSAPAGRPAPRSVWCLRDGDDRERGRIDPRGRAGGVVRPDPDVVRGRLAEAGQGGRHHVG